MELNLHTTRAIPIILLLTTVVVSPTLGMGPAIETSVSPTVRTPIALSEPASTVEPVPDPEPFSAGMDGGNRDRIVRTGMTVLGGWAVANIASGLAGMAITDEPARRGFWEMNAMWNTVNLAIAAWSLYDLSRSAVTEPAAAASNAIADGMDITSYREESHSLEKVLLFNAGLNVAYMAVGGWMWDRGNRGDGIPAVNISSDRLTGWGQSLVMQGTFLLAFDVTMAIVVAQDRRRTGAN